MKSRIRHPTPVILILAALLFMPFPAWGEAPQKLYVIERDTLQTRNFIPIVNHEIYLVNRGSDPLEFTLASPIPSGKNIQGQFYPAFLEESLLTDPLFSPVEIAPKKTGYLAKPETVMNGDEASFIWKRVTLPAEEALIAQYDNYFGEPLVYWTRKGLDIAGLVIRTAYSIEPQGTGYSYLFKYEVENTNTVPVEDFVFETFVPVKVFGDLTEILLIGLSEIAASPNITPSQVTKTDGFGRAAEGVTANIWSPKLAAGGKHSFFIRLSGSRQQGAIEAIWPVIILRGRLTIKPVWPMAIFEQIPSSDIGKFSYVSYNLVIRDSKMISLTGKEAKVIPAK